MPTYRITAPDGAVYNITGETEQGAMSALQSHLAQQPKAIDQGDWAGLGNRLRDAESAAENMGPMDPSTRAAVRQEAARKEGRLYGQQNAASGAGLIGEGVGRAADKFALGLPRLAEAYMPGVLGGQSAIPGAEAHEFLKAADEGRAIQNPGTAFAGNIAGVVGQTVAMPAASGATLLARMGTSAGQAAALGAGEAAVESRGDLGEIGKGLGLGALGGAGGQALGEGLIKAGRMAIDPLRGLAKSGPVEQQAAARVLLAAKNAGIDDATAAAKLAQLGPDGFMADILGKHGESLARSSANLSPEARTTLEGASKQRLGGQTDRIIEALRNAGGRAVGETPDQIKDNIAAASRPAIRNAYDVARSSGADMPYGPFADILASPKVQGALKQAENEVRDRVAAFGPGENSQLAVYDAAKKILDRMGWKEGDDIAKVLAKKLRDTVDNNIPEYGGARALAQGVKQQQEAVDIGASLAKPGILPTDIAAASANKFPSSVAQGFSTTKINDIANRKVGQNALDVLTGTKRGREALVAALGSKADDVMKQVAAERQFLSFDRALSGNSSTARQLAELGMVGGLGAAGGYAAGFDPMQAGSVAMLAKVGKNGASKLVEALAKKNEAAVAPKVADILLQQALPRMAKTETARRQLIEQFLKEASRAGGYSAGQ